MFFYVLYFCRAERRLPGGGRQRLLTEDQETAIVNMVIANNAIRLREIQRKIIEDQQAFSEIDCISISTIDNLLHRNRLRMKQVYRVPFERNSEQVKNQRIHYVQVLSVTH